jgi:site-specific DNA recombinase
VTRAAVYARVSSQAQRENQTIESQLRALPAYVKAQGWTLVDTYIDDGRSAKTGQLDKREGFARLLKDMARGAFDVLAVIDLDRITRTEDMTERGIILGPFQRARVRIVTPSGGDLDLRTMVGEVSASLYAIVAAEENRKRAERAKRGQLERAIGGGKPKGKTPYGLAYDLPSRSWTLHPEQSEIVREVFRRHLAGESCRTIAEDLIERDVSAPQETWSYRLLWRLVRSRHTAGEWLANRRERVVVRVPAIVDEATWQRAQTAFDRSKATHARTKHVYLLDGLGVCGSCGTRMFIRSACGPGKPARYLCKARKKPHPSMPVCHEPSQLTEDADERIWDVVVRELERPDLADELAKQDKASAANRKAWKSDVPKLETGLARLLKSEDALWTRFRKGNMPEQVLDSQLEAIHRERGLIEESLIAARVASAPKPEPRDPGAWVEAIRTLAATGSPHDRQRVVRAVVKRAIFKDKRVRVTLRLGGELVFHSSSRTEERFPLLIQTVA